jgi:hypothetical protein
MIVVAGVLLFGWARRRGMPERLVSCWLLAGALVGVGVLILLTNINLIERTVRAVSRPEELVVIACMVGAVVLCTWRAERC